MGLKMRHSLQYVATPDGVLCRSGSRFLPIKGKNMFPWFDRLAGLLQGEFTCAQLCGSFPESQRTVLRQVLDALRAADMVFDSDGLTSYKQDALQIPDVCSAPREATMPASLAIFGSSNLVLEITRAALNAGIYRQELGVVDFSLALQERLDPVIRSYAGTELDLRLNPVFDLNQQIIALAGQLFVIAADLRFDGKWLDGFTAYPHSPGALWPLLVTSDYVLVGPACNAKSLACMQCLIRRYQRSIDPLSSNERLAATAIGANLLALKLAQVQPEPAVADEPGTFYEIGGHTLEIRRRFLSPHCGPCNSLRTTSLPVTPGKGPENEEILYVLEKRLVDRNSGIIAAIDERNLIQLPVHQSEASWHMPSATNELVRTTDLGTCFPDARLRALRLALEQYLQAMLKGSQNRIALHVPQCAEPGLVVSGATPQELRANGVFRCLSQKALTSEGWMDMSIEEFPRSQFGDLAEYLVDTGALCDVRAQRHIRFAIGKTVCARFYYKDVLVSVVSGVDAEETWRIGIADVWLHLTGNLAQSELRRVMPLVRLRSATTTLIEAEVPPILQPLGFELTLSPLTGNLPSLLSPLHFAVAQLGTRDIVTTRQEVVHS